MTIKYDNKIYRFYKIACTFLYQMIYYIQKSSKNAIRSIIYSGFASCVQPAEMHTEDFAITGYETNVFLPQVEKVFRPFVAI